MISTSLNHCKEMGVEPGRRFLKQPAAKLEPVIVAFRDNYHSDDPEHFFLEAIFVGEMWDL